MDQIIVAFERLSDGEHLRGVLEGSGEFSCLVYKSAAQVKRAVSKRQLGAVVCGFKLADESGEALYGDLPEWCSMLMIAPRAWLDLCGTGGILRLASPVRRGELLAAVRRLVQLGQRGPEAGRLQGEREVIAEAKAVLMARDGMSEGQAHRFLQKRSMDLGVRMGDTARRVLEGRRL